jgi:hypothetical protein
MSDTAAIAPVQTEDSGPETNEPDQSTVITDNNVTTDDTGKDSSPQGDDNSEGSNTVADVVNDKIEPPEAYADFELDEGLQLDSAALEKVAPLFKEMGLSQENAQKLVTAYAEQVQAGEQGRQESFNQTIQGWADQVKNDSEIGGEKFDENIGIAKDAIVKFGTPELKEILETTGVGNHPEIVRFMVKVGRLTREDSLQGGDAPKSSKDRVSILYPK